MLLQQILFGEAMETWVAKVPFVVIFCVRIKQPIYGFDPGIVIFIIHFKN